jgi:CrcB protein
VSALLVALGAAVGAPTRYVSGHYLDGRWPLGTLLVNVVGSFLLGLLAALSLSGDALALLGTGFCGALTTYSALAVRSVELGPRRGTAYALGTVALALAAVSLGFSLG